MIKMMRYVLIITTLLLTVNRSSAQLNGAPPPLPTTGNQPYLCQFFIIIIHNNNCIGVRLYLGEDVRVLHDFSMIAARQFHDNDRENPSSVSPDGLNDGLWCQSANTGNMIGTWYLPGGTQLTTEDIDSPINFPLYAYHVTGQIGLLRDLGIIDYQGLYKCVIPDENDVEQTLWVAAYGNPNFDSNSKSV